MSEAAERHQVTRIRREPCRRTLTVSATEQLSAHMLRIHFTSADLGDFDSASPDDHVKLFLPHTAGGEGRPPMRDYTPRAFDRDAGTFVIDFALHDAGPATAWATSARPGDTIQIGGPRGSAVVADDFDWYLLIGDETALPSIGRRLEELRSGVPVIVIAIAGGPEDRFEIGARDGLDVRWCFRNDADDFERVVDLLTSTTLPAGDGYVWIAAEASVARAVRSYVVERLDHPREWTKAAGYWTRGIADAHERIGD